MYGLRVSTGYLDWSVCYVTYGKDRKYLALGEEVDDRGKGGESAPFNRDEADMTRVLILVEI
jgi:hypothetical protein